MFFSGYRYRENIEDRSRVTFWYRCISISNVFLGQLIVKCALDNLTFVLNNTFDAEFQSISKRNNYYILATELLF